MTLCRAGRNLEAIDKLSPKIVSIEPAGTDVSTKATGQRFQLEEMALYTVKDGKIVREQFCYNMPGNETGS